MSTVYKLLICLAGLSLAGCEEEYFPENTTEGQKYVVEGYVEVGPSSLPTYVLLTRTFDFYSQVGADQLSSLFVHGADVHVSDGTQEVKLEEVCFLDLPVEIRKQVAGQFGFDGDSLQVNICAYVDLLNLLKPQIGKRYDLEIITGTDTITARTNVPRHVPLDTLYFAPPPGKPNDELAQLIVGISDPPGERNYYRYLVSTNGGGYVSFFSSVEEDLFFDGKTFEFQLLGPESDGADVEVDEFGLYNVGDTISIKWCSISASYFNFWNTLEFSNANQGPFSSYTRLESNIEGGLGIWGGISVSYYTRVVEY